MTHRLALILAMILATTSVACAEQEADIDLFAEANASGLWNDDRTAVAVSIPGDNGTGVYVLILQPNSEYTTTDISRISDGLFAKLGTAGRSDYEKYEITPIEWITLADGKMLLKVRLRAWRDDQRYTVSGPVIIRPDGSIIWQ